MLLSYMYAQDVIEPDTHWRAIPSSHRRCVSFLAHLICGMSCVTDGNRSPSPRSVIIFCALFASPTRPKGDDVADCVHRKGAVISRPSVAWRPIVLLYCYCCWISAELLLYVLSLSLSLECIIRIGIVTGRTSMARAVCGAICDVLFRVFSSPSRRLQTFDSFEMCGSEHADELSFMLICCLSLENYLAVPRFEFCQIPDRPILANSYVDFFASHFPVYFSWYDIVTKML